MTAEKRAPGERLIELETVIERGLQTYLEVGQALHEIRENKLYREQYSTFEEYCRERWGFGRRYANRQIEAAVAVETIRTPNEQGTIVPKTESVARELVPLAKRDPAAAKAAWNNAMKDAEERGGTMTAGDVSRAVSDVSNRSTKEEKHRRREADQPNKKKTPSGKKVVGLVTRTLDRASEQDARLKKLCVAWAEEYPAHPHLILVGCVDQKTREAAQLALSFVEPPSTDDEVPPDEQERYQNRVLREAHKASTTLGQAIMEFGGIRFHDDLREEYREIPLRYRRRDGLPGDEMAEMLATHYSQFGIVDERGLIEKLTEKKLKQDQQKGKLK